MTADKIVPISEFASIDLLNYRKNFLENRLSFANNIFNYNIYNNTDNLTFDSIFEQDWKVEEIPGRFAHQKFKTKLFIKYCINSYLLNQNLDPKLELIINKLQKKFEIHHRLCNEYDEHVRRASSKFDDIDIYALFSMLLLYKFFKNRNYNYLNTALKLNDFLTLSECYALDVSKNYIKMALLLEYLHLFRGQSNP